MASPQPPLNPRIAILGAGPIGLETAFEAARRGFDVALYDAGRVAEHWRRFADVTLFTPFGMNASERGRGRLRERGVDLPPDDAILTAGEIVARYLDPLARLPELEGRVFERTRVVQIAREGLMKSDGIVAVGDHSRVGRTFLLRLEPEGRPARFERADVVIDATGVYANPRATGPGGLAALGEEALGARIDRHIVALAGGARARYAGKRVLLVGDGHSAATALVGFAALAEQGVAATVTWIRRRAAGAGPGTDAAAGGSVVVDPFAVQSCDPLPERARLGARANRIARESAWLTTFAGAVIESYGAEGDAIAVTLRDADGAPRRIVVDQVLALVGYRPDAAIHRELQVHICYASEAPMALATAMLAASATSPDAGGDCLKQTTHGAETHRTPEPGFYIVGAKSYGRNPQFLLSLGHRQIEEILGLVEGYLGAPAGASR
ncbi:MAG TPA: hypothetical protein VFU59_11885 [Candidatus Eisenbacteria bacterium]|nr:hypothetical protein [Candidatus Eisenbacteria bacterium]